MPKNVILFVKKNGQSPFFYSSICSTFALYICTEQNIIITLKMYPKYPPTAAKMYANTELLSLKTFSIKLIIINGNNLR